MKKAIIVDIDGTIALRNPEGQQVDISGNDKYRGIHDYKRVSEDTPMWPIINLVNAIVCHTPTLRVIVVTGRPDSCWGDTWDWLRKWLIFDRLFMRKAGDYRKDNIIKQEIYDEHIKPEYEVVYVLDDRDQVVQMWRSNGLICLQVANGNF